MDPRISKQSDPGIVFWSHQWRFFSLSLFNWWTFTLLQLSFFSLGSLTKEQTPYWICALVMAQSGSHETIGDKYHLSHIIGILFHPCPPCLSHTLSFGKLKFSVCLVSGDLMSVWSVWEFCTRFWMQYMDLLLYRLSLKLNCIVFSLGAPSLQSGCTDMHWNSLKLSSGLFF